MLIAIVTINAIHPSAVRSSSTMVLLNVSKRGDPAVFVFGLVDEIEGRFVEGGELIFQTLLAAEGFGVLTLDLTTQLSEPLVQRRDVKVDSLWFWLIIAVEHFALDLYCPISFIIPLSP